MNVGEMQVYSPVLRRIVTFGFSLPSRSAAGAGPYPAVLFLHGASENHRGWLLGTRVAAHLEGKPLIAIMPEGVRSQWLNRNPHERYEDFLMQDLLPACAEFFPIRSGRWGIGGYSMGGQGALHLGMKYPGRFASIYAHSSVIPDRATLQSWMLDLTDETLTDADLLARAARCAAVVDRPVLGFDCGTGDPLLAENRAFHEHLNRVGYPHGYREHPGGHTWDYWDTHVQEAIAQHLETLTRSP